MSALAGFFSSLFARVAPYAVAALAVAIVLFGARRQGEAIGRQAEQLKTKREENDAQRRMLDAAGDRPRTRNELADRMRDGTF